MIDYVNSRIIITLAAIAITGLVLSMSLISAERSSIMLAEDIADQLSNLVSTASEMKCESFSAIFSLSSLPSSIDARVTVRNQSITVSIGDYKAIRILDNEVLLVDGNQSVAMIEFRATAGDLSIRSEKNIFDRVNSVTIELIDEVR